ncbi:MAG TPA: acyl-CoA dehydrogenase family protein [Candidatus Binataceae bacterium]|nr:acyl-CoA dehydrogenase family protein [Candidatus Binataceae bacterium]
MSDGNGVGNAFTLSREQQEILDQADKFARRELAPLQERMDNEEWWPPEVMPKLASAGYLGITVPTEYGGAGSDVFTSGLVIQAMSRWNSAIAMSYGAHDNLCVNNIYRNGSEDIRRRYLPRLCDGSAIGALGLTEPGAGSDALGSMATTARRVGDQYILNGGKLFITNGPIADILLIYAKTDKAKGAHGISAFVVEKDFPGFRVAQKLDKMGFRGSATGELVFEDCQVPAANLVGEENKGVAVVMSGLDLERGVVSLISLGMAERAFDLALDYAKTRRQFGKAIGEFQMIQAKLADMYTTVETMRTFCYRTLAACNTMEIGGGGRGEIHKLAAAAILYAAEACSRVVTDAVQIHGGMGFMRETEVNRIYRGCKLMEIGAGTTEVRKIIIAGELMRA